MLISGLKGLKLLSCLETVHLNAADCKRDTFNIIIYISFTIATIFEKKKKKKNNT